MIMEFVHTCCHTLVLPFSLHFSKYGGNFVYRLSAKLSSLFILYGVYLTNSRGALLATIVMFGVYFFFRFGKIKSIFLGLLSLPLLFFVLSNFREIDSNEESASGRVEAWYEGIEMPNELPKRYHALVLPPGWYLPGRIKRRSHKESQGLRSFAGKCRAPVNIQGSEPHPYPIRHT